MPEPARDTPPGHNRRIVLYGNPVLRVKAEEVKELGARVRQFLADLMTTMLEQDGLGLAGNPVEVEATGLLARAFMHETDHLKATLFIDHIGEVRRGLLAQRLADIEQQEREAQQEE